MVVRIAGKRMYLWCAVDHEDEVLDMLVQRRRDTHAALRLMRKPLKKQRFAPKLLVTDKLGSYGSAFRQLRLTCPHDRGLRKKQSRGKLPSNRAATRAQDAAVQVSSIRAAFSQYPFRRSQHFQLSTTSRLAVDPSDLQS
jgi:transposase-like protein